MKQEPVARLVSRLEVALHGVGGDAFRREGMEEGLLGLDGEEGEGLGGVLSVEDAEDDDAGFRGQFLDDLGEVGGGHALKGDLECLKVAALDEFDQVGLEGLAEHGAGACREMGPRGACVRLETMGWRAARRELGPGRPGWLPAGRESDGLSIRRGVRARVSRRGEACP